jgi:ubiquinone biosynthesis monooxygenase Coq7
MQELSALWVWRFRTWCLDWSIWQAIAATTVAVERVVLRHLKQQVSSLAAKDPSAVAAIASIIQDEQLHHSQSEAHLATNGFWYKVVSPIVSGATEIVIWLGMRL